MPQWKGRVNKAASVLTGHEQTPIISSAGPNSRYLGRVIIEVWEDPRHADHSGSSMLAYMAQPGRSSHIDDADLIDRVISTFGPEVTRNRARTADPGD